MLSQRRFVKAFQPLQKPNVLLFDLDGTLVDTADDLGAALNYVLRLKGLPEVSASAYRPVASHGAKGLLELGFGPRISEFNFTEIRNALLDFYAQHVAEHSRCFDGIRELLEYCRSRQIRYGIVTNKPWRLAKSLVRQLPELHDCAILLGGDSLPVRKPDPSPLWLCCQQLQVTPQQCWYIGDAQRDIEAANRAGMTSVLAAWGYLGEHDQPETWAADVHAATPLQLLDLLQGATKPM